MLAKHLGEAVKILFLELPLVQWIRAGVSELLTRGRGKLILYHRRLSSKEWGSISVAGTIAARSCLSLIKYGDWVWGPGVCRGWGRRVRLSFR